MAKMRCPNCFRKYDKPYRFCPKCGTKLVKDFNRCSNPHCVECEQAVFADDDIVCGYCGSETTYEKERREKLEE